VQDDRVQGAPRRPGGFLAIPALVAPVASALGLSSTVLLSVPGVDRREVLGIRAGASARIDVGVHARAGLPAVRPAERMSQLMAGGLHPIMRGSGPSVPVQADQAQEGQRLTELAAVSPAYSTKVGFLDTDAGLTDRTPPVTEPHLPQPGVPRCYRPLNRPRRARLALHVDDSHARSTVAALGRRRTASLRRGQRQHQRDRCRRDRPAPPHAAVLPPRVWFVTTNCDPPAASGLPASTANPPASPCPRSDAEGDRDDDPAHRMPALQPEARGCGAVRTHPLRPLVPPPAPGHASGRHCSSTPLHDRRL
jgi:hypothetical protein